MTSYFLWARESYPPFSSDTQTDDPGDDPAVLSLAPQGELKRWLPLVKWLLIIPDVFVLFFLAEMFVCSAAFFAMVFTGHWPKGMRDYAVGVTRWVFRIEASRYLLHDDYPPFSLR